MWDYWMKRTKHRKAAAHLVGSVPLQDSAAVFACVGSKLGHYLSRIPDGETGERSRWIRWQFATFANCPQLVLNSATAEGSEPPSFRLRDGMSASEIELGPLGYSDAAITSFTEFTKQKRSGQIAPDCRFQVSLPTPLAPVQFYISSELRRAFEPIYEAKLLEELRQITAAIPASELAVQWDTAVEFGILEGVFPSHLDDPPKDILQRLLRLGDAVPSSVELGYHLCYGDSNHQHFVEPEDATHLVTVANGIAAGLDRTLHWMHLPVPRERFDESFYRPLSSLKLSTDTELYLGLIHMTDGEQGARRRIRVARNFVTDFGVATECGFGRRPIETISELLKLHADVTDHL